jgi:hypothetical protein
VNSEDFQRAIGNYSEQDKIDIAKEYQKSMKLADGAYFSPDGGSFWAKGDALYWEDGEITSNEGKYLRCVPMPKGEDFSLWSYEERREVREKMAILRELNKKEGEEYEARQSLLVNSDYEATKEEYGCCLFQGAARNPGIISDPIARLTKRFPATIRHCSRSGWNWALCHPTPGGRRQE